MILIEFVRARLAEDAMSPDERTRRQAAAWRRVLAEHERLLALEPEDEYLPGYDGPDWHCHTLCLQAAASAYADHPDNPGNPRSGWTPNTVYVLAEDCETIGVYTTAAAAEAEFEARLTKMRANWERGRCQAV